MSKPTLGNTSRPSEQMIRDRLRNRRSLYELEKASGSSFQRLGRSFFEEREDISAAAPVWQRYPVRAFVAAAAGSAAVLALGAFVLGGPFDAGKRVEASLMVSKDWIGRVGAFLVEDEGEVVSAAGSGERAPEPILEDGAAERPAVAGADPSPVRSALSDADRSTAAAERIALREDLKPSTSVVAGTQTSEPEPATGMIDRSLTTAGIAKPSPSVAHLLEQAREIEEQDGPIWPGLIEDAASPELEDETEVATVTTPPPAMAEEDERDLSAAADMPSLDTAREAASAGAPVPLPALNPRVEDESRPGSPSLASASPAAAPGKPGDASTLGFAKTFVNMRQSPEMEAAVLTVLSEGAPLMVYECEEWCRVSYQGTEGYVFGTFVVQDGSARSTDAG